MRPSLGPPRRIFARQKGKYRLGEHFLIGKRHHGARDLDHARPARHQSPCRPRERHMDRPPAPAAGPGIAPAPDASPLPIGQTTRRPSAANGPTFSTSTMKRSRRSRRLRDNPAGASARRRADGCRPAFALLRRCRAASGRACCSALTKGGAETLPRSARALPPPSRLRWLLQVMANDRGLQRL
jgi:hypothetical protein